MAQLEAETAQQRPPPALDRLRLREPRRARRGGAAARRGRGQTRGRVRGGRCRAPLRARAPRSRPRDPHVGRAADLELPALAVGVRGARLRRHAVAGLRRGAASSRARGVREPARDGSARDEPARSRASSSRRPAAARHRPRLPRRLVALRPRARRRAARAPRALRHGARASPARPRRLPRVRAHAARAAARRRSRGCSAACSRRSSSRSSSTGSADVAAVGDDLVRRDAARRRRGSAAGSGSSCSIRDIPEFGFWAVMAVLFTVFAADTGAFFVGRTFGRHKHGAGDLAGEVVGGLRRRRRSRRSAMAFVILYQDRDEFLTIPESLALGARRSRSRRCSATSSSRR